MKEGKQFIGYRYCSYTTTGGYKMHEIQVYHLEEMLYNGPSGRLWSSDLFTIELQSGRGYGDGASGTDPRRDRPILTESYAAHVQHMAPTEKAYKALRPFIGTIDGYGRGAHRGIVKALRKLRAVKIAYDAKESSFFPARFKRMPSLYFEARKNGLTIAA